jgi:hypothetical protein
MATVMRVAVLVVVGVFSSEVDRPSCSTPGGVASGLTWLTGWMPFQAGSVADEAQRGWIDGTERGRLQAGVIRLTHAATHWAIP